MFALTANKKATNDRRDELDKLSKQLKQEQLLKMQAVNKLAEIMARKENIPASRKPKASANDLRRKEKECRRLQQELSMVSLVMNMLIYKYFSNNVYGNIVVQFIVDLKV